ncbi:MAL1 Maltase, partial [Acromyrmex charruanus]
SMSWAIYLCALLLFASSFACRIQSKLWWNNTVFYQIYPRSFYDSDADGIGDLKGITSKLDYIAETGINAIWLSPIYTSPMVDFGYDISDFVDIDPIFGSLKNFKALLARAKKLGLKVVLDLVPNHTSDKHIWFQKALQGHKKYKNYYIWADGRNNDDKTPPNNWISVFGGSAWTYEKSQKQWYFHQFEYRQPDLNFRNPAVRKEMLNVLKFWLDLGVDGFRVDSAPFIYENPELLDEPKSNIDGATLREHKYLKHIYTMDLIDTYKLFGEWRKFMDSYASKCNQDQKLMVMEAYSDPKHTMQYYYYNLLPFNFKFITNVNTTSSAQEFKQQIDLWMNSMPRGKIANWALGNHDNPRIASRYPNKSDQMIMLSMVLPGLIVTYNGEEIGMVDKRDISWQDTQDPQGCIAGKEKFKNTSRDPERTPFQWDATKNAGFSTANSTWLPVHQNYKKLNLANQIAADKSHYKIYKTLAHMHRTEPALTEGSYKSITTNNNTVLGIIRNNGSRVVLLLINFSDDKQVVDLSQEKLPSKLKVKVSSMGSKCKSIVVCQEQCCTCLYKHSTKVTVIVCDPELHSSTDMVDVTTALPSNGRASLIGRTRGALRSVRTALGGSGEYLQGLGNRIGSALSSSLEESELTTTPSTPSSSPQAPALQPIKSEEQLGRRKLRLPRFGAGLSYEDYEAIARHKLERQGSANLSRTRKYPPGMTYEEIASSRSISSKKQENHIEQDDISPDRDSQESIEPIQEQDIKATGPDPYEKLNYKAARAPTRYQTVVFRLDMPCSSDSTSDQDGYGPSTSLDSNMDGRRIWQRSGSSGSVQSWASSLSADSQSEEAAADFMKAFVPLLFDAPNTIDQEQKANFGQMVLTESGRIWFSRVVNARRARACVTEASFYSLAQHFAVALFECHEADDFAPAKSLMNMCFTFYHEVEVPGLEPYREYLYTHLRVQPIWTSMRFWTAAFFDAVQCERASRPVPPRPKSLDQESIATEDRKFQANIVFGQLGTFTCNMHAFGLSRALCTEFLRKQCIIANLTKEQEKMLRDNIDRMFDETEPWR